MELLLCFGVLLLFRKEISFVLGLVLKILLLFLLYYGGIWVVPWEKFGRVWDFCLGLFHNPLLQTVEQVVGCGFGIG